MNALLLPVQTNVRFTAWGQMVGRSPADRDAGTLRAQLEPLQTGAHVQTSLGYEIPCTLPARTGRHAIYVIWQRIDPVGEGFYALADVDFGPCDERCENGG